MHWCSSKDLQMKILKYIVLAAAIACAMTWLQYHPILEWIEHLAIGAYIAVSIVSAALGIGASRKKLGPRLAVAGLMVLWGLSLYFDQEYRWSEIIAIKTQKKKYENCKKSGIDFNEGHLSVCNENGKWWRYGFTESIIYDSSGQIMNQHRPHSPGWINAALTLNKQAPFGIVGFEARPLTGNFYLVTFYDDLEDELISECRSIHDRCILRQR